MPPSDTGSIDLIRHKPSTSKAGEMGEAFTRRKTKNSSIDLAFEQGWKNVDRPFRRFNECEQPCKAGFMAVDQGTDAGVQTMKRLAVGWKDEHVVRHFLTDRLKCLQPIGERVCLWLQRLYRNIG